MPSATYRIKINAGTAPLIEIGPDGVYVWFKRNVRAAKTIIKSDWPHVAVDVDEKGEVIGVECCPPPESFSFSGIIKKAGLSVSDKVAARAEIKQVERTHAALSAV